MKEPSLKVYILYDVMYMTFWKRLNNRDREQKVVLRGVVGSKVDCKGDNMRRFFCDEGVVLCPDCGTSMTPYVSQNLQKSVHQKKVNCKNNFLSELYCF